MDQDVTNERPLARRPWLATVGAALAIASAVVLAVTAWSFADQFDGGWPEGSRWWLATIACSVFVLGGLALAILNTSRSTAAISAVVLASTLAAFAVGVASWGKFASLAHASAKREAAAERCITEIKSMSIDELAESRHMTSVMMVRPSAAMSFPMIPEPPARFGGGGFAKKQRAAAAKAWDKLRADERAIADVCAASQMQFGGIQGVAGTASNTGAPVDVIIE